MFASLLKFHQRIFFFLTKEIIFNFTHGKTLASGQPNYTDQGVDLFIYTSFGDWDG